MISHLRYKDNALFTEEASLENLWYLKAIIHFFEFILDLNVNLFKSVVIGVKCWICILQVLGL